MKRPSTKLLTGEEVATTLLAIGIDPDADRIEAIVKALGVSRELGGRDRLRDDDPRAQVIAVCERIDAAAGVFGPSLYVGQTVLCRGNFGRGWRTRAVIADIELCPVAGMRDGVRVQHVPLADKDRTVVVLSNGSWAYGHQLDLPVEQQHAANPENQTGAHSAHARSIEWSKAVFRSDIPSDAWLQEKLAYTREDGVNQWGVPRTMGPITGSFNREIRLPVELLATVPGERAEQANVRADSLRYIRANFDEVARTAVYVEVDPNGKAWMAEGNHRVIVAAELGVTSLPVHVRFFTGGERLATDFEPQRLVELDAQSRTVAPPVQSVDDPDMPEKEQRNAMLAGVETADTVKSMQTDPPRMMPANAQTGRNSTFYTDGFREGHAGQPESPPPSFRGSNVYANEYREGHGDGRLAREAAMATPGEGLGCDI